VKEMVDLLGEPPEDFLRRSEHSSRLFDENGKYSADCSLDGTVDQIADYRFGVSGKWIAEPPITALSLQNRVKHIEGDSKVEILDFLKSMLCWLPEERKSARELLGHPWLSGCED
jgi:serine/threonine-protein kinase SRPK3